MSRVDRLALLWGLRRVLPVFVVEQKGPSVIGPTTRKPLEKKKKERNHKWPPCLTMDILWVLIGFQRRHFKGRSSVRAFVCSPLFLNRS